MTKKNKAKRVIMGLVLGLSAGLLLTGVTAGVYAQRVLSAGTIYPQITVEGIVVYDLSPQEAQSLLETLFFPQLKTHNLRLIHEGHEWEIPFQELGFNYFYEEILTKAMKFGRNGSMLERLAEIKSLREQPVNLTLSFGYSPELLDVFLRQVASDVYKEPVPATIYRRDGAFHVVSEQSGWVLDLEATRLLAHEILENKLSQNLTLAMNEIPAYPTASDLRKIEAVISEFSTTFNTADIGRTSNLRKGAGSINGILMLPGAVFSFNETTGPRTISSGYQEAPVILRGELVPGIGGGICQVSTTLYNAVVRADLQIIERTNHSLPVSYVPRGQDAAVAYGSLDFRFQNNLQEPIFLESETYGNRITVRIFGQAGERPVIDLVSETVQVIEPSVEIRYDPTLYEDVVRVEREAKKGYRVVTYKVFREGGRVVSREVISRDFYRPVNGIVVKGTKPRLAPDWLWNQPELSVEQDMVS